MAISSDQHASMMEAGHHASRGIAWSNLGFSVKPGKSAEPDKQILADTVGLVRGGEVLYILGPSGAGKSSMLDSLVGHVGSSVASSGTTYVHGRALGAQKGAAAGAGIKYVAQNVALYETLTARETLTYAAEFYCTAGTNRAKRVDTALQRLGLRDAQDTKCGGIFYRGLSGGQQRRVSIGIELVARPDVLLCDEPTSGLDSASALQVMEHLRDIARSEGIAVVCTVHQPGQRIFALCDTVMFLSGGKTAYFGPANRVIPYFEKNGHSIPPTTSVSEWVLDELNGDFNGGVECVQKHLKAWDVSEEKKQLENNLIDWIDGAASGEDTVSDSTPKSKEQSAYKRDVVTQTVLLSKRNVTEALRNPAVIYLRAAMYVALAVMISIAWVRLPSTADRVQDRFSGLFYISSFMIFMSIAVQSPLLHEKSIVSREISNGSYSPAAFLMGRFVMEFVFIGIMSFLLSGIMYYAVGYNRNFSRFLFFGWNLFVSLLCAESIMVLVAAVVPFLLVGIAMGAFIYGFFMVLQGFFVEVKNIPWILRWAQYISLHRYSFSAFAINELSGSVFGASPDTTPAFPEDVPGEVFLENLDVILSNKWANIAVMAGMIAVYRLFAWLSITKLWSGKR